ncbi:capsular biosynthesis protein [Macrococcoides caseolyticum]|nr:capsular biosynthesis protein [Macrococcus caseolyticus]HCD18770.1 capsular biosynthesis protein [Macrococcus caseolyticus]
MKIAIISSANIMHMTLINHYLKLINLENHELDIIYTDKYNMDEEIKVSNKFKYFVDIKPNDNKFIKLNKYLTFRKYVNKIVNKKDYDLYIIWNSYTAQLLGPRFFSKIKNKYILNIRDYTYENNKIIYYRMKYFIEQSIFTTVSSDGFKSFLPKSEKIIMLHSINEDIVNISNNFVDNNLKIEKPINISFIGNVRFYKENKRLISVFANDERFILNYHGVGYEPLKKYCDDEKIMNVNFTGRFEPKNTISFLNDADVINNYYGKNSIALTTAISIRLYYAVALWKPILVTPDTYTSTIATKLGIGFSKEINKNYADELYFWINSEKFRNEVVNREKFLVKVTRDNELFREKFLRVLKNEHKKIN